MAMDIYHSALAYFIANQDELCKKYNGKELLMTADSVAGVYDSAEEAFLEGKKRFGSGNFALQTCLPGEEAYSVSISPLFDYTVWRQDLFKDIPLNTFLDEAMSYRNNKELT